MVSSPIITSAVPRTTRRPPYCWVIGRGHIRHSEHSVFKKITAHLQVTKFTEHKPICSKIVIALLNAIRSLLKKVFRGVEQIFLETPVQWSENDVGGHIISPISDQQPS